MLSAAPMATVNSFQMFLWYSGTALLGVVAILLWVRRLYGEFPVFGFYIVFHLISSVVGLWAWKTHGIVLLDNIYRFSEFTDAILSFTLVLEIIAKALVSYPGIRRAAITVYLIAAFVLFTVAIWMVSTAPDSPVARIATSLAVLQRSAEFVRLGLLLILFLFCRFFGLTWKHYLFGIALGLGAATAIEAVNSSLRVELGWKFVQIYVVVAPLGYDLGLIAWVYYLVASESEVRVTQVPHFNSLTRWNTALEELLGI
jgi:hypothetical protein